MHRALRFVFVCAVVMGAAIPALAASPEGAEKSPGLFAGTIAQSVAAALVFLALLAILYNAAWGPILKGLQSREEFIKNSLDEAKKDREEAQKTLEQYKEQLAQARDEAASIVGDARRSAESVGQKATDDARAEADQIINRAREEIGLARDQALKEVYEQSVDLAALMAGRIISRQLNADDHRDLVRQVIDDLDRTASN
jgi:F-type H+-transporting ATPase subunit b